MAAALHSLFGRFAHIGVVLFQEGEGDSGLAVLGFACGHGCMIGLTWDDAGGAKASATDGHIYRKRKMRRRDEDESEQFFTGPNDQFHVQIMTSRSRPGPTQLRATEIKWH